jgi:cytochrome c553
MRSRLVLASVVVVAAVGAIGLADAPKPGLPKPKAPLKEPAPKPPGPKQPAPKEAPPAERFEHDMMLRMHMHENFDLLRAIERLLIRGKLEDATRFATAISDVPDAPAHGSYAAQAVLVRDRAAAVARATTVDQACKLEAKVAAACGGCHVEAGVVAEFRAYPPAPPDVQTLDGRMARHRWAADRLWEGVVGAADEPWNAGLDVLASAPFDWGDRAKERATLAGDLQRLADAARKRKVGDSLDNRATSYGEMLATCAACHTLKPATPPPKKK